MQRESYTESSSYHPSHCIKLSHILRDLLFILKGRIKHVKLYMKGKGTYRKHNLHRRQPPEQR